MKQKRFLLFGIIFVLSLIVLNAKIGANTYAASNVTINGTLAGSVDPWGAPNAQDPSPDITNTASVRILLTYAPTVGYAIVSNDYTSIRSVSASDSRWVALPTGGSTNWYNYPLASGSDGTRTVYAVFKSRAGVVITYQGSIAMYQDSTTLDTTPPAAPTIVPSNLAKGNVTVTINYSSDSVEKQYKIGTGSYATYSAPFTVADGSVIYAKAKDTAGNWCADVSKEIHLSPPNVTVNPNSGAILLPVQTITVTAVDIKLVKSTEYRWDNETAKAAATPVSFTVAAPTTTGVHTLYIQSTDSWQNTTGWVQYIYTVKDITAPTVSSVLPANGAVNVPVDSSIVIKFSESIKNFNDSYLKITNLSSNAVVARNVVVVSDTITIKPQVNLSPNTTYLVTLSNGTVTDMSGNPLVGYRFSFTTETLRPSLIALTVNQTNVKIYGVNGVSSGVVFKAKYSDLTERDVTSYVTIVSNSNPSVAGMGTNHQFAGMGTAGDATIVLSYTEGTAVQQVTCYVKVLALTKIEAVPSFMIVKGLNNTAGGNVVVNATYSNGEVIPVEKAATYASSPTGIVTVAAGVVQSGAVDGTATVTATYQGLRTSFVVTVVPNDTEPPKVIKTSPIDASIDVAPTTPITIVFSENVLQGANWGGISLKDSTGNTVTVSTSLSGIYLGLKPAYLLPKTRYIVTIPQGAVKDAVGNALAASFVFSFTVKDYDNMVPNITVSPVNDSTVKAGDPITVSIADVSGVDPLATRYSWDNGVKQTPSNGTSFTVNVPLTAGTHMLYVEATDKLGNWGQSGYRYNVLAGDILGPVVTANPASGNVTAGSNINIVADDTTQGSRGVSTIVYNWDGLGDVTRLSSDNANIFSINVPVNTLTGQHILNVTAYDNNTIKNKTVKSFVYFVNATSTIKVLPNLAVTPAGGSFNDKVTVTIDKTKYNSYTRIYYVLGGDNTVLAVTSPNPIDIQRAITAGTIKEYTQPFDITQSTTLRAIAVESAQISIPEANPIVGLSAPVAYMYIITPKDTTAPTVVTTTPARNATNVAVNTSIQVVFSEALSGTNAAKISGIASNGDTVTFTNVTVSDKTVTFVPNGGLKPGVKYLIDLLPGAVSDTAGNQNSEYSFTFLTATDGTSYKVASTTPANNATNVAVDAKITVMFNRSENSMNYDLVTVVDAGGTAVPVYSSDLTQGFVITPTNRLKPGTKYTVNIPAGTATDYYGVKSDAYTFSFTTAGTADSPVVTLSPNGGEVAPGADIVITATDSEGIAKIEYAWNNGKVESSTTNPLTIKAPTVLGTYTLQYQATDNLGHVTGRQQDFVVKASITSLTDLVITPAGGTFKDKVTVTIDKTKYNSNTHIYYALGAIRTALLQANPDQIALLQAISLGELKEYTQPFDITNSETLRAIAVEFAQTNATDIKQVVGLSKLATCVYTKESVQNVLPTPKASKESGKYDKTFSVKLMNKSEYPYGTKVYYTVDGSTPGPDNDSSKRWISTVTVRQSETLKAVAIYKDRVSQIAQYEYHIIPRAPKILSTVKSSYTKETKIRFSKAGYKRDTELYYTLDGTNPTQSSTLWDGDYIVIDKTTTLKAIAVYDEEVSNVSTFQFNFAAPSSFTITPIINH